MKLTKEQAIIMFAFYSSPNGTIKVYYDGSDWKLTSNTFDKGFVERWYSVWQSNKLGSLKEAIVRFDSAKFDENLLFITGEIQNV